MKVTWSFGKYESSKINEFQFVYCNSVVHLYKTYRGNADQRFTWKRYEPNTIISTNNEEYFGLALLPSNWSGHLIEPTNQNRIRPANEILSNTPSNNNTLQDSRQHVSNSKISWPIYFLFRYEPENLKLPGIKELVDTSHGIVYGKHSCVTTTLVNNINQTVQSLRDENNW